MRGQNLLRILAGSSSDNNSRNDGGGGQAEALKPSDILNSIGNRRPTKAAAATQQAKSSALSLSLEKLPEASDGPTKVSRWLNIPSRTTAAARRFLFTGSRVVKDPLSTVPGTQVGHGSSATLPDGHSTHHETRADQQSSLTLPKALNWQSLIDEDTPVILASKSIKHLPSTKSTGSPTILESLKNAPAPAKRRLSFNSDNSPTPLIVDPTPRAFDNNGGEIFNRRKRALAEVDKSSNLKRKKASQPQDSSPSTELHENEMTPPPSSPISNEVQPTVLREISSSPQTFVVPNVIITVENVAQLEEEVPSTPLRPQETELRGTVPSTPQTPQENEFHPDQADPFTPQTPVNDPPNRKRKRMQGREESPKRKRGRNPELHQINIRKNLYNSGQAYTSARNKEVPGKAMRPPCACKWDCLHRIPEDTRAEIFSKFWALGNHQKQWEFIRSHCDEKLTRTKGVPAAPKKRKKHRNYFFMIGGEQKKVCKYMFMSTLDIWDSWIDSAFTHVNVEKGMVATPDKRGRHANHPKAITPAKVESVKKHVNIFPRVPSHYTRLRSKREFLETHVRSLCNMARLYKKWAEEENLPKEAIATQRQYIDCVNSNFNIAFFLPKKDQCNLCNIMKNKLNNRAVREKFKDKWVAHLRNKKLSYQMMRADKAECLRNRKIALCSFDLQKQLNCPKSESSVFFYKNKLTVHNFTVFNDIKKIGKCYMWHNALAKKGSNEIASSVLDYLKGLHGEGYEEVRFYSDNCGGQNKNRFLFAMYLHAAVMHKMKIVHRFLETGHTMMAVDSIHARIENYTKDMEIWDFDGWVEAVENAKIETPKYEVQRLNRSNVFSYKDLVSKQNWDRDVKNNVIKWSKVREVQVDGREQVKCVKLRYDLEEDFATMTASARVGRPVNLENYNPPKAYTTTIPLSANVVKDIKSLVKDMAIPLAKHKFYEDVLAGVDEVEEEVTSDIEYDSDEELCIGTQLEDSGLLEKPDDGRVLEQPDNDGMLLEDPDDPDNDLENDDGW